MPSLVSGFTLVELLVVISVMGIITGLALTKYRGYGANAYFANASENIVLALRQAQVYGVGVKKGGVVCGGATEFDCSYGVYFSTASPDSATVFVDVNNDGLYSGVGEIVQVVNWNSPIALQSVLCDGAACVGNALNVTFKRPNPTATILDGLAGPHTTGAVTITNGSKMSTVTITKTGQISLQ